ncbi:hypothetical protein DFH07DRAFT_482850 [Mycena maculata]|uniref:MYND-type domain-containing protein n=1 Tax=Mycena maculata TaxID=230809 RepID=A0AAD7J3A6_9AGAR|nr:hypothetical protein DFH07DRAFT_482850 [Mycena maculata]
MEQNRRRSKKAKTSQAEQDVTCSVCDGEQKSQSERFRICSGCKEKLGTRRYFCSRACQKTDWKTHKEFCGSQDFWDYPHRPLLTFDATFERPAALRCQIALIDTDPDVLYNIAPGTDDVVRFTIKDKMLNVSFRRVRDKAFTTLDPESIAILGQILVCAVEAEGNSTARIAGVYRQLEEEYPMDGIAGMVGGLLDEQRRDPLNRTRLQCLHQENMAKHGSDFWRALVKSLD